MRHWVFDLDGTLVDSFGRYFASLGAIFEKHGKSFGPVQFHAALTKPFDGFLSHELGREALSSALALFDEHSRNDATQIKAFDGIIDTLAELRRRKARIAVWTNRDLASAKLVLEASGLESLVELCVSGTCVTRKPSPDGLHRLLSHFECKADEVVVVGDHEHDVTTPKGLGARGVRASWHGYWKVDPCTHADHQFYSVPEFQAWVRTLSFS